LFIFPNKYHYVNAIFVYSNDTPLTSARRDISYTCTGMINNDPLDNIFTSTNLHSWFAQVNLCNKKEKHILLLTLVLLKYLS